MPAQKGLLSPLHHWQPCVLLPAPSMHPGTRRRQRGTRPLRAARLVQLVILPPTVPLPGAIHGHRRKVRERTFPANPGFPHFRAGDTRRSWRWNPAQGEFLVITTGERRSRGLTQASVPHPSLRSTQRIWTSDCLWAESASRFSNLQESQLSLPPVGQSHFIQYWWPFLKTAPEGQKLKFGKNCERQHIMKNEQCV